MSYVPCGRCNKPVSGGGWCIECENHAEMVNAFRNRGEDNRDKLIRQQAADIKVLREALTFYSYDCMKEAGQGWLGVRIRNGHKVAKRVLASTDPNRVIEEVKEKSHE